MTIPIPGTLFVQYHSGWKVTYAYVYGAGYRVFIEDPAKGKALSFRIDKENEKKLYDSLRLTHRDENQSGLSESKPLETDGISQRSASD